MLNLKQYFYYLCLTLFIIYPIHIKSTQYIQHTDLPTFLPKQTFSSLFLSHSPSHRYHDLYSREASYIIFYSNLKNQYYYLMSSNPINLLLDPEYFVPQGTNDHTVIDQSDSNKQQIKLLQSNLPNLSNNIQTAYQNTNNLHRNLSVHQLKFYQEYKRIYSIAFNLWQEKQRIKQQIEEFVDKIQHVQAKLNNYQYKKDSKEINQQKDGCSNDAELRNKRSRRTAEEIQKKYKCLGYQCQRYYGTEGSLQQHIKLKHPEIYKLGEQSANISSNMYSNNEESN